MQLSVFSKMLSCMCFASEMGFGLRGSELMVKSLYLLKYGIGSSDMNRSCMVSVNLLCRKFSLSLMAFIFTVL